MSFRVIQVDEMFQVEKDKEGVSSLGRLYHQNDA